MKKAVGPPWRAAERGESMGEVIGQYLVVSQHDAPGRKTHRWHIYTRAGDILGTVEWYGQWRQYTFNPREGTTYSGGCLRDIMAFLERVNKEQRQPRGQRQLTEVAP